MFRVTPDEISQQRITSQNSQICWPTKPTDTNWLVSEQPVYIAVTIVVYERIVGVNAL